MFMVVPSGSTKPATLGLSPRVFLEHSSAAGRVALLELVEKAVTSTPRMSRKNASGLRSVQSRSHKDIVPKR